MEPPEVFPRQRGPEGIWCETEAPCSTDEGRPTWDRGAMTPRLNNADCRDFPITALSLFFLRESPAVCELLKLLR